MRLNASLNGHHGSAAGLPPWRARGARVWRSDEKTELQLASEPFLRAAEFYKRSLVEPALEEATGAINGHIHQNG